MENPLLDIIRPNIPVEPDTGVRGYDPELGRTRKMAWSLTINSNVRSSDLNFTSVSGDLKGAVDNFFARVRDGPGEDFLDIFKVYHRGTNQSTGLRLPRRYIQRVTWAPGNVETGHRRGEIFSETTVGGNLRQKTSKGYGNRIHYHGVLTIYHYSNIRLDLRRLTQYFNNMLTFVKDQNVYPSPDAGYRNLFIMGVNVFARSFNSRQDAFNRFQYANKTHYHYLDQMFFAGESVRSTPAVAPDGT